MDRGEQLEPGHQQRTVSRECHHRNVGPSELCPDCRGGLVDGPRGGLSINRRCTGCAKWFNFHGPNGELGVERLTAERDRVLIRLGERELEADVVVRSTDERGLALFFGVGQELQITPNTVAVGMLTVYLCDDGIWREFLTSTEITVLPLS